MSDQNKTETDLDRLRNLLLGSEKNKIEVLEQHFDDPIKHIEDVSSVLPDAIKLSTGQSNKLTDELMPVVEEAVKVSIKRDTHIFADALYPVMGPAIRKSMSEALMQMMQSINKALEHSFSWQGIKWRFEAWKSGKPFAEIVLMHSLVYQVEQVFLIHKKTGLLLHHTALAEAIQQDADLVSAMLTAIQDFVLDSFNSSLDNVSKENNNTSNVSGSEHSLNQISMGEFSIWIEQGPNAVIAAVLKGTAPKTLRQKLIATLEDIHQQHASAMQDYNGDETTFNQVDEQLQSCLLSQYQTEKKKISWMTFGIIGGILIFIMALIFLHFHKENLWQQYVNLIKSEPGIVVTDVSYENGQHIIRGLRDPLAREINQILSASSITHPITIASVSIDQLSEKQIVHYFEPYQSLTDQFIQKRAIQLLKPPATTDVQIKKGVMTVSGKANAIWIRKLKKQSSFIIGVNQLNIKQLETIIDLSSLNATKDVKFNYNKGLLHISGYAPDAWIKNLPKNALSIPGVERINLDELVNSDTQLLKQLKKKLEAEAVFYSPGQVNYTDSDLEEDVKRILSKLQLLIQQANYLSIKLRIIIKGFSDSQGIYNARLKISYLRAEHIRQFLIKNGINESLLDVQSMVSKNDIIIKPTEQEESLKRRVSFTVNFL